MKASKFADQLGGIVYLSYVAHAFACFSAIFCFFAVTSAANSNETVPLVIGGLAWLAHSGVVVYSILAARKARASGLADKALRVSLYPLRSLGIFIALMVAMSVIVTASK